MFAMMTQAVSFDAVGSMVGQTKDAVVSEAAGHYAKPIMQVLQTQPRLSDRRVPL